MIKKTNKKQAKAEEKRIVLLRKDGVYQILGRTNATSTDLCNKSSFLPITGGGMSLVKMHLRFALYKELNVPTGLMRFNGMQQ